MHPAAPVTSFGPSTRSTGDRPRTRTGRWLERLFAPFLAPVVLAGALAVILATRLAAVGVKTSTSVSPGAPDRGIPVGAAFFVTGLTERGDTVGYATVRSMAEYRRKLGARVSYGYLYDALETFFAEGGALAYVARIVGPAATKGVLALVDRAGTPLTTLTLTAKNAGAWSANMDVEVVNAGPASTFTLNLYVDGVLVEQYAELVTPAAAATAINARSELVTAVDNGSATSAPNNNPAVIAATALSPGADDRASVNAATYTAALNRFTTDLGAGIAAIPGQTSANVAAALEAHCRTTDRRIYATATAAAQSVAQAQTAADARRNAAGAEFGGLFYPWVKVPDGAGGTRTIPPEAYVAACRTRALRAEGPYRSPAGAIAVARHVVGVEAELTAEQVDDLSDSRVNSIIVKAGSVRLYGWRSLSTDAANYRQLTARDMLNVLGVLLDDDAEEFVHGSFDGAGRKLGALNGKWVARLEPYRRAGGLFERHVNDDPADELIDPGYVVNTGPEVNTAETLANDEVHGEVGIRVSPTGEVIYLAVSKVPVDAAL